MGGETQNIAEQPPDTRHTARELWSCGAAGANQTPRHRISAAPLEPRLLAWPRAGPWLAGGRSRDAVLGCDWSSRQPHSLVSQARGALGGRRCLARAVTLGAGECGVKRKTLNLFSGVQESSNIDISRFRILCLSIKTWLPFSRFWF